MNINSTENKCQLEMIETLISHLSKRPIAPILENSKEKHCEKALKFMTVVDYYTDDRGLYDRMKTNPKLLTQLMRFYSYEKFQYYECYFGSQQKELIGEKISKCKFCEFIGPYIYTLEHIIISHGTHISLKECLYCNRELALHEKETIQACYWKHLAANEINIDTNDITTIQNFYKLLKEISKYFDVLIRRQDTFGGVRYLKKDPIKLEIEGLPLMYEASKSKISSKRLIDEKLDYAFRNVMTQLYGSNSLTMFTAEKPAQDNSTIIILSDDDDENATPNQEPKSSPPELRPVKIDKNVQITETTATHVEPTENAINDSSLQNEPRNEPEPQVAVSSTMKSETDDSQSEEFGRYVGSRLRRLSDTRKRRRLELEIQKTIIKLEEEDI